MLENASSQQSTKADLGVQPEPRISLQTCVFLTIYYGFNSLYTRLLFSPNLWF